MLNFGGNPLKRITRGSKQQEPPAVHFDDEDSAEFAVRREEIRRGKRIDETPEFDIVLGFSDTEDDEDIDPGAESGDEDVQPLTYTQALKAFRSMTVKGTRYIHRETMVQLAIARDVDYMLEKCGLSCFVSSSQPSYKEETCQFLASVEMNVYDADMESLIEEGGSGYMTFKAKNDKGKLEDYAMTVKQFETLFELPSGKYPAFDYEPEELQALWKIIAGPDEYLASRSISNAIRNPAVHYFHKVIANSCFPRSSTRNVRPAELEMMDEGLKELLNRESWRYGREFVGDKSGDKFTTVLLIQLLSYRFWAKKLKVKKKGIICVGGIVTAILKSVGARLKSDPIPPNWIDIPYLKRTGYLERTPSNGLCLYKFIDPESEDEELIQLPHLEFTTIELGNNIHFRPPREALCTVGAPEETQQQRRDEDEVAQQEPDCYYFDDDIDPKWTKGLRSAHRKTGLLQKWNKLQDNVVETLVKSHYEMKDQIKALKRVLRFSSHSKEKTPPPMPMPPTLRRTRSVSGQPRRRSTSIPARKSSHIPRTASGNREDNATPQVSVNFDPDSGQRPELRPELSSGEQYREVEQMHHPQVTSFHDVGEDIGESSRPTSHFMTPQDNNSSNSAASEHTMPIDYEATPFSYDTTQQGYAPVSLDYDPAVYQPPHHTDYADPFDWTQYFK